MTFSVHDSWLTPTYTYLPQTPQCQNANVPPNVKMFNTLSVQVYVEANGAHVTASSRRRGGKYMYGTRASNLKPLISHKARWMSETLALRVAASPLYLSPLSFM